MTEKEVNAAFDKLKKKYPGTTNIEITYYGSGDSFEDFDVESDGSDEVLNEDVESLLWHYIDVAGADFNDEGGRGTIDIDLKKGTIRIVDYYYTRDEELNCDKTEIMKGIDSFELNENLEELTKLLDEHEDKRK